MLKEKLHVKILDKVYIWLDTDNRKKLARTNLKEALEKTYHTGYLKAESLWKEKLKQVEDELKDEFGILLASKEIEVEQLNKTLADFKEQLKHAREAYKLYYHDTIANKKLVAEIAHQIRNLFNSSGEIYKSFISIQDAASNHFRSLLKNDPLNRNLLGLSLKPDEFETVKKTKKETFVKNEIDGLISDISNFQQYMLDTNEEEEENE